MATGEGRVVDHPVEMPALRADGTEFPVELAIRRLPVPAPPEPPLFIGFVRDITERLRTERELRELAAEQAALHRVAALVARGVPRREVVDAVTEEVGRLLGAQTATPSATRAPPRPACSAAGTRRASTACRSARPCASTTPTRPPPASTAPGSPRALDSYEGQEGELADLLRELGFRSSVGAPIFVEGELWGALLVSSVKPEPFGPGVEHRIAAFAELTAQALANAEAREELRASRARIVEAADAARRRIERDLHDGAQQRLVALALTLRRAKRCSTAIPRRRGRRSPRPARGSTSALAELRELARGIHPAVLSEHGLPAALAALADRAPLMVELDMRLAERPREAGRGGRLLRRGGGADERRPLRRRPEARVTVERLDGRAARRGGRRRLRRRGSGERLGTARAGRPRGGARRAARGAQPGRRGDDRARRAALGLTTRRPGVNPGAGRRGSHRRRAPGGGPGLAAGQGEGFTR